MELHTILVVDDDPKIRALLRNVLEDEGFAVKEAENGAQTLQVLAEHDVNLITLDIHLGQDNGIEIAREIRKDRRVPIIMVTGKDDVIDRVVGLEVGADDYITKPFHIREVIARIRSVLRRTNGVAAATDDIVAPASQDGAAPDVAGYHFDGMIAAPDQMTLLDRSGAPITLTSGDFRLLGVFLERPKRVLSRDQLMDLTGGQDWTPLDRTIDNQIARLRKKIEHDPSRPQLIKTVRGIGYLFASSVTVVQSDVSSSKSA